MGAIHCAPTRLHPVSPARMERRHMPVPTVKPQAKLLEVGPARLLTADDMKQSMQKQGAAYPASNPSRKGVKPFYPTIGAAKYKEYKTQLAPKAGVKRPTSGATAGAKPLTQVHVLSPDFDGSDDLDFLVPPD